MKSRFHSSDCQTKKFDKNIDEGGVCNRKFCPLFVGSFSLEGKLPRAINIKVICPYLNKPNINQIHSALTKYFHYEELILQVS